MGEPTKQSSRDLAPGPAAFWRCRHCRTPNPARPYLTHCLGCGKVAGAAAARGEAAGSEPERGGPAPSPIRASVGRLSAFFTATWAVFVLLDLLLIRWVGDRWWGVTVLLFVPR